VIHRPLAAVMFISRDCHLPSFALTLTLFYGRKDKNLGSLLPMETTIILKAKEIVLVFSSV
jgi:hypothetical protein